MEDEFADSPRDFYGELAFYPPRPTNACEFEVNLLHLAGDLCRLTSKYASSFRSIPDRRDVIEQVRAVEPELRDLGVAALYLFGSVARGDASWNSDVDIGVRIGDEALMEYGDLDAAMMLEQRLRRHVDIVLMPFNDRFARCVGDDLVKVF